jgi:hypothetical protein
MEVQSVSMEGQSVSEEQSVSTEEPLSVDDPVSMAKISVEASIPTKDSIFSSEESAPTEVSKFTTEKSAPTKGSNLEESAPTEVSKFTTEKSAPTEGSNPEESAPTEGSNPMDESSSTEVAEQQKDESSIHDQPVALEGEDEKRESLQPGKVFIAPQPRNSQLGRKFGRKWKDRRAKKFAAASKWKSQLGRRFGRKWKDRRSLSSVDGKSDFWKSLRFGSVDQPGHHNGLVSHHNGLVSSPSKWKKFFASKWKDKNSQITLGIKEYPLVSVQSKWESYFGRKFGRKWKDKIILENWIGESQLKSCLGRKFGAHCKMKPSLQIKCHESSDGIEVKDHRRMLIGRPFGPHWKMKKRKPSESSAKKEC